jgi:hypothetical protein
MLAGPYPEIAAELALRNVDVIGTSGAESGHSFVPNNGALPLIV